MELIQCTVKDAALLAELNKQLFEDEKNDCIPAADVLTERFRYALEHDSIAFFFVEDGSIAGYALVKHQTAPCYLSHFFICREFRRKHLGTIAFNLLLAQLNTDTIDLDVFCWNERGQAFWKSLGFKERCIIMRKSVG